MTCKHRSATWSMWSGSAWSHVGRLDGPPLSGLVMIGFDRITCLDCGEMLGLGPANDTGEHADAVRMEKRAAELAQIDTWWDDPQYESESYGALCFHNGGTPGDDDDGGSSEWVADEWAGYLARCIATHEEES